MKSVFVFWSAVILLQGISGYSTHEYKSFVAKNVNGFATVEGVVSKDGVTKRFYKVIPEYSSADSTPSDTNEFVFPDPVKIPEIKLPEFPHFQEPHQIPTPTWDPFSVNDNINKVSQDIFEQNKKIHESINSNFWNSFSNQPGFDSTLSNQPSFARFSSQPIFGSTFSSQPGFGHAFSSLPTYTYSHPAFANTYSTYPGFGNTFPPQRDYGHIPQFSYENAGNSLYYPQYPQFNYWL